MRHILFNIAWFLTGGVVISIIYFAAAVVFLVSIVFYKAGTDTMRIAWYALLPFGQPWKNLARVQILDDTEQSLFFIRAILWFPFMIALLAVHLVLALLLFLTIIGIPLARLHFALARFALFPLIDDANTKRQCFLLGS